MSNTGDVWVLVFRACPDAPWESISWGFGDETKPELEKVRDRLNAQDGSEEWAVFSQSELVENRSN